MSSVADIHSREGEEKRKELREKKGGKERGKPSYNSLIMT